MRFIRTYEEFRFKDDEVDILEPETEVELSNTTIDDVLSDKFLKDEEDKHKEVESRKTITINNWKVY